MLANLRMRACAHVRDVGVCVAVMKMVVVVVVEVEVGRKRRNGNGSARILTGRRRRRLGILWGHSTRRSRSG